MGWRRSALALALGGLAAAALIAVLTRSTPEPEPEEAPAQVTEPVRGAGGNVEFVRPKTWQRRTVGDVTVLSPRNGGLELTLSAPGPSKDWKLVREQTVEGLKVQLKQVDVLTTRDQQVDGRPSQTTVLSAKQKDGGLRVLVTSVKGRKRAYLITLFTPGLASPAALREAQGVMDSLELRK